MNLQLMFPVIFFLISEVYCKNICKHVTTFDAICKNEDILYILSANPCIKKNSISVTIINMKNESEYIHKAIDHDTKDPLPIFDHPGKGVIVIMHLKPASDEERDYRKTQLHVKLDLVDVEEYKKAGKPGVQIIEVYFYIFFEQCKYRKPKNQLPPLKKDTSCRHSQYLGEFSSLCIVSRNTNLQAGGVQVQPGIYITIADMCTVPYSVTIIALLFSGHTINERFTQDKTDKYLAVSSVKSQCGLVLQWHDHHGEYIHSKLKYGCGGDNITLTDVFFTTYTGIMCPLSSCVSHSSLNQTCHVPWIHKKAGNRTAVIRLKLEVCFRKLRVWLDINLHHINKTKDPFHFEEKKELIQGHHMPLHLAIPRSWRKKDISKDNGYLYLDGGGMSLQIIQTKMIHVTVIRYYPTKDDEVGPLFHTEFFWEDVQKAKGMCASPSDNSLTIGLTIALIAMLVFVVIVIMLVNRRRKLRLKGFGLPYQIHLSQSTQYMEMEDELASEVPDEYSTQ